MTYNNYEPQVDNGLYWSDDRSVEPIGVYTAKTFGWMALGLLATFAVAFATVGQRALADRPRPDADDSLPAGDR